jgi:hypothetical protein
MDTSFEQIKSILTEEKGVNETNTKIYQTVNYGLFNLSEFNRKPKHYKKILDSIKKNDMTMYNPCLVTAPNELGQMDIIDGQNRFLACKELGLPIHFIIGDKLDIFDAPMLNDAAKNWSIEEYVRHYAKRGVPAYKQLLYMHEEYGVSLTPLVAITKEKKMRNGFVNLRTGKFKLRSDVDLIDFLDHHAMFHDYLPFANKATFVRALFNAYKTEGYDKDHMLRKLDMASGTVNHQPTVVLFVIELEKLYNYHVKGDKYLVLQSYGKKR